MEFEINGYMASFVAVLIIYGAIHLAYDLFDMGRALSRLLFRWFGREA